MDKEISGKGVLSLTKCAAIQGAAAGLRDQKTDPNQENGLGNMPIDGQTISEKAQDIENQIILGREAAILAFLKTNNLTDSSQVEEIFELRDDAKIHYKLEKITPTSRKCYIAGPITGKPNYNEEAFINACQELIKLNYIPVNPHNNGGGNKSLSYSFYMTEGVRQLVECNHIYMLKGWQESRGAVFELFIADVLHKQVLFEDETSIDDYVERLGELLINLFFKSEE